MSSVDTVWIGDQPLIRLSLEASEAGILAEIADQFVSLVTDTPDDPAAAALFPKGYADPAAQAEFSRFTHEDLNARKIAAATLVRDTLRLDIPSTEAEPDAVLVELETAAAWDWLTFFTDIRLVLAERMKASPDAEEHSLQKGLYDWTAYLQGAMVDELSRCTSPS